MLHVTKKVLFLFFFWEPCIGTYTIYTYVYLECMYSFAWVNNDYEELLHDEAQSLHLTILRIM